MGDVEDLGGTLAVDIPSDEAAERLGTALHGFLASDSTTLDRAERLRRARHWVHVVGKHDFVEPHSLVEAANHFWTWVEKRWPTAQRRSEVPVHWRVGDSERQQVVRGTIDLLLETDEVWVVIDHKTGGGNRTERSALDHGTQLEAYARALAVQPNRLGRRIETWLHFILAGVMTQLREA